MNVDRKDFGKKIKVTKSRGHLREINELGVLEQQKTECSVFSDERPTTKDHKNRHKKTQHSSNLNKVKLEPISHDAQLEESDPLSVLSKQRSSLDRKLPPMELNSKAQRNNNNNDYHYK